MRFTTMLALAVCLVLATSANAGVFTLSQSQLMNLDVSFKDPANAVTGLIFSKTLDGSGVHYEASLQDSNGAPFFAEIGIGSAAGGLGAADLSAFSGLSLTFTNVNNSIWSVAPYLRTAGGGYYQPALESLDVSEMAVVDLDFAAAGVTDAAHVTDLGFVIAGIMNDTPPNPSVTDITHIHVEPSSNASTVPLPEPSSLVLAVLAFVGLVGYAVRRRAA
ncbi:MAG: PEP-CTERM sorting domain-containing protein [Pirellulales bacterium]